MTSERAVDLIDCSIIIEDFEEDVVGEYINRQWHIMMSTNWTNYSRHAFALSVTVSRKPSDVPLSTESAQRMTVVAIVMPRASQEKRGRWIAVADLRILPRRLSSTRATVGRIDDVSSKEEQRLERPSVPDCASASQYNSHAFREARAQP